MKSVEPSIGTSKRPSGEASTTAPASGDQPATKEIYVDPTTAMDLASDDDTADPKITPPLSLCAMMGTFMTTQVTHGQLIDELLTMVASLRADFAKYRTVFPPPPPFDP